MPPRLPTPRHAATLLAALATVGAFAVVAPSASSASAHGTVISMVDEPGYGKVLVLGSSPNNDINGSPLYEFSGDVKGHPSCGTTIAYGYDLGPTDDAPLTCTGPERDFLVDNQTDDWPSVDTSGAPVAGPGVRQSLLGTIHRKGVGTQVTYAGHPLYLFDAWTAPFDPQGVRYLESVFPLLPWHGLWSLVSATNGAPVDGTATLRTEKLPGGTTALAVVGDPNSVTLALTVYTDPATSTSCTGSCAVTWLPVLTVDRPHVTGGVSSGLVGEVARADGERQVTYDGHPLWIYARERVFFVKRHLQTTGSAGNGRGLVGPGGGHMNVVVLG